ncbi:MAG: hypothetical protein HC846_12940 [Blastocatellia bacterium]|nr:hypothetical protein [Blastocatellia bacterium]
MGTQSSIEMLENKTIRTKILSQLEAEDFIGRTNELDEILRHAKEESNSRGMLILSAPSTVYLNFYAKLTTNYFANKAK